MSARHVARSMVVVLAATLATVGCSLWAGDTGPGQVALQGDGVVAWAQKPAAGDLPELAALVVGRVDVRAGCVVLRDEEGDTSYPVVWPAGTELVKATPLELRTADLGIRMGDLVTGGGGYLQPGMLSVSIPGECLPETSEVAVFNPSSSLTTN